MATDVAADTLTVQDQKAETAIASGMAAVVLMAFLPGPISMIAWIGTLGLMTNGIADAYGHYDARKDNLVERVISILMAGGVGWLLRVGGMSLLSGLLALTGIGYAGSVAINLAVGIPLAYAVAKGARAYYRGEATGTPVGQGEMGNVVREAYDHAQRSGLASRVTERPASEEAATEQMRQALRDAEHPTRDDSGGEGS